MVSNVVQGTAGGFLPCLDILLRCAFVALKLGLRELLLFYCCNNLLPLPIPYNYTLNYPFVFSTAVDVTASLFWLACQLLSYAHPLQK